MAFDFDQIFTDATPGGKTAEDWIKQSAKANEYALWAIAEEFAKSGISMETAQYLLGENERALKAQAAASKVIMPSTRTSSAKPSSHRPARSWLQLNMPPMQG